MAAYQADPSSKRRRSEVAKRTYNPAVFTADVVERRSASLRVTLRSAEYRLRKSQILTESWRRRKESSQIPPKIIRGRVYEVVDPEGRSLVVWNLRKFCQSNGLSQANLASVVNGRRNHHRGYRARLVDGRMLTSAEFLTFYPPSLAAQQRSSDDGSSS